MNIRNNRVKVLVEGTGINVDFILLQPVDSFTAFTNGDVLYTALAETGEWQVARGTVTGTNLTRGIVEENYLGTTDQIDFTGKKLQIAQTLSAEFMNELTSISHDHNNKVILDNTTASYTDEEEIKLAGIEEDAQADQVASEVPVNPVGDIVATDVQSALEELDTELTAVEEGLVVHGHDATEIVYDPTEDDITTQTDVQLAMQDHATSLDQRVPSSSGIISGLDMFKVTALTFQINIGRAEIYDSYTTPDSTVVTELELTVAKVPTINYSGLSTNTIQVYLNSALEIYQATGDILASDVRDKVYLGSIYVINGEISDISNAPIVIKQTATDVLDLMRRSVELSGGNIIGVTGILGFYADSAKLFSHGINYRNNTTNPNELTVLAVGDDGNAIPFYTILQTDVGDNGSVAQNNTLSIPLAYNPIGGSAVTALVGTEATIHRIYGLGLNGTNRQFFLSHGQTKYATSDAAESALDADIAAYFNSDILGGLQLYAYMCVSANSTDFDNESTSWIVSELSQFVSGESSGPSSVAWGSISGILNDQIDLKSALNSKEPWLDNPAQDGMVLKSTILGIRTWESDIGITDHMGLTSIGANTHAEIDAHIAAADNPHNTIPADIIYDPTSDKVTTATDLKTALIDHANSIEQRVPSSTGVISGGRITPTVGSVDTHIDVALGSGEIINNYSDPNNASIQEISWPVQFSILVDFGGLDSSSTKIYLNSSGSITQVTGAISLAAARDNIFLGVVYTLNGVIVSIIDAPSVVRQTASDAYDSLVTNIHTSGSEIRAVNSLLSVWAEAAKVFFPGINYYNDPRNPNSLAIPQNGDSNSAAEFFTVTQDGAVSATPLSLIPTAVNASGGIVSALQGNDATIHRLYSFGLNPRRFLLLYGQNTHTNASVAKDNLFTDTTDTTIPSIVERLFFLAYIGVSNGSVDFGDITDAWIISGQSGQATSGTADTTDHIGLTNLDAPNQHPIASIGISGGVQLQDELNLKTECIQPVWVAGTYDAKTLAHDNNGLYISNRNTSERPSPQLVGDPLYLYAATMPTTVNSSAKQLAFKTKYDWTVGPDKGQLNQYRIYTIANQHYTIYLTVDPEGAATTNELSDFTATSTGWQVKSIRPIIVNNIVFEVTAVVSEPNDTPVVGAYTYNITAPNNSGTPAAGNIIHANTDLNHLHIAYNDDGGTNRSGAFALLTAGDIIDTGTYRYSILAAPVDNGTYYTFLVSPTVQSPTGITAIDFETVTATPIEYVEDDLYWSTTSFVGKITGDINLDGISQGLTDSAFGVDIEIQDLTISTHWDFLAGEQSVGTPSAGSASWGLIDGDINAQIDLIELISQSDEVFEYDILQTLVDLGAAYPGQNIEHLYVTLDDNQMYRWFNGSYESIGGSDTVIRDSLDGQGIVDEALSANMGYTLDQKIDNLPTGGGSNLPASRILEGTVTTDGTNATANNVILGFSDGSDVNGAVNSAEILNGQLIVNGLTNGAINYFKRAEGATALTVEATIVKPVFGRIDGFAESYHPNGKWYEKHNLVANGDFSDGTTTGWVAGSSGIISIVNNKLRVKNGAASYGYASYVVAVEANKKYKFKVEFGDSTSSSGREISVGTTVEGVEYITSGYVGGTGYEVTFTPTVTGNIYITLYAGGPVDTQYSDYTNLQVSSLEESDWTEITTPQTYLPIEVEADISGNIVQITDTVMPQLTLDALAVKDIVGLDKPLFEGTLADGNMTTAPIIFNWSFINIDTHNAMSTGTYTIPKDGYYSIHEKEVHRRVNSIEIVSNMLVSSVKGDLSSTYTTNGYSGGTTYMEGVMMYTGHFVKGETIHVETRVCSATGFVQASSGFRKQNQLTIEFIGDNLSN